MKRGLYPYKVSENENEEYEDDEEEEETEKKGFWERVQESDKAKKFMKSMRLDFEDINDDEEEDEETNKTEKWLFKTICREKFQMPEKRWSICGEHRRRYHKS